MMMQRRSFLMSLLVAPVIVKASSLMAIKPLPPIEGRFDTSPEDGIPLNSMSHPTWKRVDIFGTDAQGRPIYQACYVPDHAIAAGVPLTAPPMFKHVTSIKLVSI